MALEKRNSVILGMLQMKWCELHLIHYCLMTLHQKSCVGGTAFGNLLKVIKVILLITTIFKLLKVVGRT